MTDYAWQYTRKKVGKIESRKGVAVYFPSESPWANRPPSVDPLVAVVDPSSIARAAVDPLVAGSRMQPRPMAPPFGGEIQPGRRLRRGVAPPMAPCRVRPWLVSLVNLLIIVGQSCMSDDVLWRNHLINRVELFEEKSILVFPECLEACQW